MLLSELEKLVKNYDADKGWWRRNILGDAHQVFVLKKMITEIKNHLTRDNPDLQINLFDYLNFAGSNKYKVDLSDQYLNSGRASAKIFKLLKTEFNETISRLIQPSPMPAINPIALQRLRENIATSIQIRFDAALIPNPLENILRRNDIYRPSLFFRPLTSFNNLYKEETEEENSFDIKSMAAPAA